jgi:hypothetical protein
MIWGSGDTVYGLWLREKPEGVRPMKKGERKQGRLLFNSSSSYLGPYPFHL